ncbi:hypothetical protein BCR34DRAFT_596933 [Clohesyomyces aquaticus]|uniref:Uncharacterized protein n=1 Tax=Clohesyomyces aquaticus TaxID=1231657 RepID=A0A1Y2A549_9PLEO|nr:hypothetical protein BCR34DRAFT_596933 [Clohesyomyces aquaticus]
MDPLLVGFDFGHEMIAKSFRTNHFKVYDEDILTFLINKTLEGVKPKDHLIDGRSVKERNDEVAIFPEFKRMEGLLHVKSAKGFKLRVEVHARFTDDVEIETVMKTQETFWNTLEGRGFKIKVAVYTVNWSTGWARYKDTEFCVSFKGKKEMFRLPTRWD